ncbi:hypothetical protein [Actinotalea solisilvae]|uniref:hypothetical protein n=1 Tax=Actinotalea solisilvae TaxID=2072922 RepID=UPI0018F21A00|nr:hypothetical protein [Actinotalea solisilvae]
MSSGRALDRASATGAAVADRREALNAVLRRAAAQGAPDALLLAAAAEAVDHARALEGAVAGERAAGRLGDVVEALVAAAAAACARGRWREGSSERWALSVVPVLEPWVLAAPDAVTAAVVAAAPAVRRGADAGAWVRLLAAAASATPPDAPVRDLVRPALLVAAWRSGLSRYRDAALDAVPALPSAVAAAVLGLEPGAAADLGRDVLEPHRADPWWWPDRPATAGVVARYGGFRGLGGPWLTLPAVVGRARADDGGPGWLVHADGQRWVVVDDAHGVSVVRAGTLDAADGRSAPRQDAPPPDPRLLAAVVPWDDEVTGAAACPTPSGTVVLVSRAHSYGLDLVRLPATGGVAVPGAAA